jgi:hypothetical protein
MARGGGSSRLLLELDDPEGDASGEDGPHALKAAIDMSDSARSREMPGLGKQRHVEDADPTRAPDAVLLAA